MGKTTNTTKIIPKKGDLVICRLKNRPLNLKIGDKYGEVIDVYKIKIDGNIQEGWIIERFDGKKIKYSKVNYENVFKRWFRLNE